MISLFAFILFLASAGAGLNAGLFFIFSICIMRAFGTLPAAEGMAAMNAINVVIQNPLFFLVFMGTALLALIIAVLALLQGAPGGYLATAGALVFLIGSIGVTIVINVPMNEALAAVDPTSPQAAALWDRYLGRWTNWNHVRSIASLAAMMLFVAAYGRAVSVDTAAGG